MVLKVLKRGKSGDHNGLQAEYLKNGGPLLHDWILQIWNAILHLESKCTKTGIVTAARIIIINPQQDI